MNKNQAIGPARGEEVRNGEPSESGAGVFEIRIKGHLNRQWSDWLGGLEMRLLDSGETILSGTIVDQAALMGILNNLNRLNLTILSVSAVNRKA